MAGITVQGSKPLDGVDLKPLLLGSAKAWPERMIFSYQGGKASVRTDRYRLDARGALFDMQADPGQDWNVAERNPEVAAKLSAELARWKKDVLAGIEKDDRPFPVGYREFPATPLPARDGVPSGKVRRSSAAPNCSYFTNWRSTEDKIAWDIEVHTAGEYEAIVYYTCPEKDAGSTVELSFGGAAVRGKVAEGFDPPLANNMDRVPRGGESYVKDFRPLRLGTFHLEKGRGQLAVRALKIPGEQVMDLRVVFLNLLN
jgi:hypothetical protein